MEQTGGSGGLFPFLDEVQPWEGLSSSSEMRNRVPGGVLAHHFLWLASRVSETSHSPYCLATD